ncbi:hypothetical protein BDV36DRAFT_258567 [Aspergillus pseudocaelatus]|uniref:Uncharacterized protein n=1 Tax=Aspergillus pseudocaelatus TaxID=1825620 RepID=A0ABQ6WIA7_9EURO|nr:hypothetical protein BDV36DRAFT_258567 [Aspergillus pseudocaelatus]
MSKPYASRSKRSATLRIFVMTILQMRLNVVYAIALINCISTRAWLRKRRNEWEFQPWLVPVSN